MAASARGGGAAVEQTAATLLLLRLGGGGGWRCGEERGAGRGLIKRGRCGGSAGLGEGAPASGGVPEPDTAGGGGAVPAREGRRRPGSGGPLAQSGGFFLNKIPPKKNPNKIKKSIKMPKTIFTIQIKYLEQSELFLA